MKQKRNIYCWTAILLVSAVIAVIAICQDLTNEKFKKVQRTSSQVVLIENLCVETMELNPLKTGEHPEIQSLIEEYYQELLKTQDFAEDYQNIEIFTKRAKYKDTYVVFAKYEMKIKDIFSAVPGLETFYVVRDGEKDGYRIEAGDLDDETEEMIQMVAAHDDAVALLEQTEKEYKETIQSDALLREALADLQNAYKDSGV